MSHKSKFTLKQLTTTNQKKTALDITARNNKFIMFSKSLS